MQWLAQLIGCIPRSPESSSLLQFPVDEHSQNQSFRELLSPSVQADNEPITVPAPAADGELCASPVAAVPIPSFSLPLQTRQNSAQPVPPQGKNFQIIDRAKKGKNKPCQSLNIKAQ